MTRLTDGFRRPHVLHPGGLPAGIRAVLAGRYDVVHAHVGVGSPLAFFVARAAARAGIPVVLTVHSLWAGVRPLMAAFDLVGRWQPPADRLDRRERGGGGAGPPAAAPRPAGHGDPRRDRPAPVAWPGGTRGGRGAVLAAVMRLSLRKRPFALLRMVREAQARLGSGTRLHLLVAGDGPLLRWVQASARRHAMTSSVTLAGRLDRGAVRELLRGAHVFVAPADLESFGIAALEARCAGLPVVAKASGGGASSCATRSRACSATPTRTWCRPSSGSAPSRPCAWGSPTTTAPRRAWSTGRACWRAPRPAYAQATERSTAPVRLAEVS